MTTVINAIQATIANEKMGSSYFARPNGSAPLINGEINRTHQAALDLLGSVNFVEVTDELHESLKAPVPGVKYFRFDMPEGITAVQGVEILSEMTDEELSTVRVVRAHHQDGTNRVELVSNTISEKTVDYGHLIIGPTKEDPNEIVVWTWFPGDVTAYIDISRSVCKLLG